MPFSCLHEVVNLYLGCYRACRILSLKLGAICECHPLQARKQPCCQRYTPQAGNQTVQLQLTFGQVCHAERRRTRAVPQPPSWATQLCRVCHFGSLNVVSKPFQLLFSCTEAFLVLTLRYHVPSTTDYIPYIIYNIVVLTLMVLKQRALVCFFWPKGPMALPQVRLCMFVCLSIYLSIYLSICLFYIHICIYRHISVCSYICMYVCRHICHICTH